MIFDESALVEILCKEGEKVKESVEFNTGDGGRINNSLEFMLKICSAIQKNNNVNLNQLRELLNGLIGKNGILPNERKKIQRIIDSPSP